MNVRVIMKPSAGGIIREVQKLPAEVVFIADPVLVITGVPDTACNLVGQRVRVAAFDELNAS